MFIYPDNLTAKAKLWLWELRDIAIIGIGALLSVLALSELGWVPPLVLTFLYGFLSIQLEGSSSILQFLHSAVRFLFLQQQQYEWRRDVNDLEKQS